jgi:alpha-glucosidase
MGTFGTGPFDSDGAADFLADLAGRPASERHPALARLFSLVRSSPDLLWREFFPDEVVAAAAVVAASLPGGERLRQALAEEGLAAPAPELAHPELAAPELAHPELAGPALAALEVVAAPGGPWHQGWTTPVDASDAVRTVEELVALLRTAVG